MSIGRTLYTRRERDRLPSVPLSWISSCEKMTPNPSEVPREQGIYSRCI